VFLKLAAFMAVMMVLLTGCKNDSGGGPSSDDDVLSLIKQANGALLGVRDAESAKAAKPTIQQLTVRLREAAAKSKKAGKTGPPANEDDRTAAAAQELTGNALRVKGNPATNDVIGADLDAFMNVMAGNG
jgi:hypothetical protein